MEQCWAGHTQVEVGFKYPFSQYSYVFYPDLQEKVLERKQKGAARKT